jgi:site-specific DNA recombinase
MSKRAVIYARVSGDDVREGKEGRNLTEQVKMGREYAKGKGYSIVAELAEDDRGASGASMDLPQLNRVFSMAQAGEFDVLIVREMDRLSRDLAKQLWIEKEMERARISIEYVLATYENTPEGELSKHIKAVISEYERLKINERMTRGRRVKVQTGSIINQGRKLYGYEVITNNGKTTLAINPQEAEIVRLIFRWFADGMSAYRIVKELSHLAIPTPADRYNKPFYRKLMDKGQWGHSSVYNMLNNESYIGSWYYSKSSPKSPNSKLVVRNPREKWIRAEVPAIIDPETWEATRRVIASNKKFGAGNLTHDYLMWPPCLS